MAGIFVQAGVPDASARLGGKDWMNLTPYFRYAMTSAAAVAFATVLSGCMGDPTYGTGQTQSSHLVEDLGNMVSLPKNKAADVKYQPRPDLVQPPKAEAGRLPPPQKDVASKDNPNWPKSPEQVRKEMVARIDEESGNGKTLPLGASPRRWDGGGSNISTDAQTRQFRDALTVEKGNYSGRRFLSDPPADLKVPASTAPTDQLGKPEKEKERERLAAAKKKGTGGSWWPF